MSTNGGSRRKRGERIERWAKHRKAKHSQDVNRKESKDTQGREETRWINSIRRVPNWPHVRSCDPSWMKNLDPLPVGQTSAIDASHPSAGRRIGQRATTRDGASPQISAESVEMRDAG